MQSTGHFAETVSTPQVGTAVTSAIGAWDLATDETHVFVAYVNIVIENGYEPDEWIPIIEEERGL
jgi:hypothetical protein